MMKEKFAIENLREIKKILDENRIIYWLDMGTLLCAIRDRKFLEWDKDVDLGIWHEYVKKIVSIFPDLKKRGFEANVAEGEFVINLIRNGCPVQFNVYRKRHQYAWTLWIVAKRKVGKLISWLRSMLISRRSTRPRRSSWFVFLLPSKLRRFLSEVLLTILDKCGCIIPVVVPKHYFENLSTVSFYGMQFHVPFETEEYLEYRYGKNWKTPMKNWVYYKDDGAINLNWDWRRLLLEDSSSTLRIFSK